MSAGAGHEEIGILQMSRGKGGVMKLTNPINLDSLSSSVIEPSKLIPLLDLT